MGKLTHKWIKSASSKWEDAWVERLRGVGEQNLAIISRPGSPVLRLEAFVSRKVGRSLIAQFGGRMEALPDPPLAPTKPSPPVAIRGRLRIFSDRAAWEAAPRFLERNLLVPQGMAFGTGSHATTASCLRMLCDFAPELPSGFSAADLGTGTGILAMGASALGAQSVLAIDNDTHSIRTAKTNARINGFTNIHIARKAVDHWSPEPATFDLITANLFSELLIRICPSVVPALRPRGLLILSGILRNQWNEIEASFRSDGLQPRAVTRSGKWVAGTFQTVDRFKFRALSLDNSNSPGEHHPASM
jgi:ribosomal protein L11 methyltransferase